MLYVKVKYNVSGRAYHEIASLCRHLPRWNPTPEGTCGVQQSILERFKTCLKQLLSPLMFSEFGIITIPGTRNHLQVQHKGVIILCNHQYKSWNIIINTRQRQTLFLCIMYLPSVGSIRNYVYVKT